MHRAFAENQNFSQPALTISDPTEIHHMRDVLRIKKNDQVVVFNGAGQEATARVLCITKKAVQLEILNVCRTVPEAIDPYLILACAIPKKDKLEWIIEKATELGVMEIIPLKTERTEFALTGPRKEKKYQRYKVVAINAARQCQRLRIPQIHPVIDFDKIWGAFDGETRVLIPALIKNRDSLKDVCSKLKARRIAIMVGPEGDFTPEEVSLAVQHGAVPVSLGETVLKVETAAISAVAFTKFFLSPAKEAPCASKS